MKTVFVVEDDLDIRESLADLLEGEGFKVASAENGKIALDKLRIMTELPGLILLDIMMPVMDGQVFRKLQLADNKISAVPVVITSAGVHLEPFLTLEFLKKPVDLDKFLEVVRRYCG